MSSSAMWSAGRNSSRRLTVFHRGGRSSGRNSAGRITIFHRGGGAKRLYRRIDLNRSTSSMGIVERIEYDPNRSSRIALVRWIGGMQQLGRHQIRKSNIEEFAPPPKILEPTTTTICGPFSFSSLPRKVDKGLADLPLSSPGSIAGGYAVVGLPTGMRPNRSMFPFTTSEGASGSKKTCAREVFFSALSSPKAKGTETAQPLSLIGSSFPRIAVAGAKPTFFAPRMRSEKDRGKNTFSLSEIRQWRKNSVLWAHRIKRKAALSWQSFRRQETDGLVGAAKRKMDQGSLPASKPKDGTCRVDRAPVSYIIASHQLEAGKMVMNCDWSKPSTSGLLRPAQNAHTS